MLVRLRLQMEKIMKQRKKVIEELNLAFGTEMMKASRRKVFIFKDKTKYNRKEKYKNRQEKFNGDFCF